MINVIIKLKEEIISASARENDNLLDVIRRQGIQIDAPCNGNGTCGKCKVKLIRGQVVSGSSNHKLRDEDKEKGYILACQSTVVEPIEIEILQESILNVDNIKIENKTTVNHDSFYHIRDEFSKGHGYAKSVQWIDLDMDLPNLEDNISDLTRLTKFIKKKIECREVNVNLSAIRKLPKLFREVDFKVSVVYTCKNDTVYVLDVKPQSEMSVYGIAVDIGTTSVSACLVDLIDDKILGEVSCANAQSKYGADVINRIVFASKKDGLKVLKKAIVDESINPLIRELCRLHSVSSDDIYIFSASGNTTMTHLLLGVYPDYLRQEPYIPALTQTDSLQVGVADVGLCINESAQIILSPSVASYVGGDITAGVVASQMRESHENTILIDLGTNGEIVFGNSDYLMTCACSAGPAFEGGEISCGMRAAVGAIESVKLDEDTFTPHFGVIGGGSPRGICGSGIIDLISELKRVGLIDSKGKFIRDINAKRVKFDKYGIGRYILAFKEEYGIESDLYITEIDVDNFIKAKGAVYSATYVLISSLGVSFDEIDNIKIAGGIGNHINIESAVSIGLFPDIDRSKYSFIGNSSLKGSYLNLVNATATQYTHDTSDNMTYIELSAYPGYMEEFVSACFLPHTDASRFPSV